MIMDRRAQVTRRYIKEQIEREINGVKQSARNLPRHIGDAIVNAFERGVNNAAEAALAVWDTGTDMVGSTVMTVPSALGRRDADWIRENYEFNVEWQNKHHHFSGSMNAQGHGEFYDGFRMGNTESVTSAYNGCGWIAIYNTGHVLKKPLQPAEIILYIELNGGFTLGGRLGTNPNIIRDYLNSEGINAQMQYMPRYLDKTIKSSTVSILAYIHGARAHYVTIQYEEGKFKVFNEQETSSVPSVKAWLNEKGYTVLNLITVQ